MKVQTLLIIYGAIIFMVAGLLLDFRNVILYGFYMVIVLALAWCAHLLCRILDVLKEGQSKPQDPEN